MEEQAQNNVGNETGSPRRMKSDWPAVIVTLATPLVLAGGVLLVMSGAFTTRTHGSARSCKVVWEERQAEIDAAVSGAEQGRTGG